MATPEGRIKTWLDTMLRREGVYFFSPQAGPYGTAGVHDRIGLVCGLFFSVECKANAQCKMTALQERFWEKVEAAGGKCFLVYDKETIEQLRQWIVSTRNSRQAGDSAVNDGQADNPGRHTNSASSKVRPSACASQAGRDTGLTQPRV